MLCFYHIFSEIKIKNKNHISKCKCYQKVVIEVMEQLTSLNFWLIPSFTVILYRILLDFHVDWNISNCLHQHNSIDGKSNGSDWLYCKHWFQSYCYKINLLKFLVSVSYDIQDAVIYSNLVE